MGHKEEIFDFLKGRPTREFTNADIRRLLGMKHHQDVYQNTQLLLRHRLIKGRQQGRTWHFSARSRSNVPASPPDTQDPATRLSRKDVSMMDAISNVMPHEAVYLEQIADKDVAFRGFLRRHSVSEDASLEERFEYLTNLKEIIGNFHNDVSFLATLMAKRFLERKFGPIYLDAGEKPQGAPGPDIGIQLADGRLIHCEIKTTKPYQPGFGAQQKAMIKKDLAKLIDSNTDLKFMMVTDQNAFETLCGPSYLNLAKGIVIVNLLNGETFSHE